MNSELVVDVQTNEISIALLEDGRLSEINREKQEITFSVGNIYYGRVKKIMPGLNAAFVDVGHEKDAFLHYLDLSSVFNSIYQFTKQAVSNRKKTPVLSKNKLQPEIGKEGTISDILTVGQEIMVQVAKEPISTKGPRLTSEISLSGRFLVLIPFSDKISISNKIGDSSERMRLKQLIKSITPKGFGVIVRTAAEGKKVAELDNALNTLVKRWDDTIAKLQKSQSPALISEEVSRTTGIIRDIFNPTFQNIYINNLEVYDEVRDYVEEIAPELKKIVKHYKGELPIFDNFGVTKQLKSGLGKTVSFRSGSYLIIEHTEALHVIDVNSGNRLKAADQEKNAFEVNMAAADEIAHQLRLRDMGGIIVIDFIDMHVNEHKQRLYEHMREIMSRDRAKHNVLPLSKFGLMQITRQRVRPVVTISVNETCPVCFGKGKVQPTVLFTERIEDQISLLRKKNKDRIVLHVHPYIEAYITKGWLRSVKYMWKKKYGNIKILPSENLGYLEYKFFDKKGTELNLEIEVKK